MYMVVMHMMQGPAGAAACRVPRDSGGGGYAPMFKAYPSMREAAPARRNHVGSAEYMYRGDLMPYLVQMLGATADASPTRACRSAPERPHRVRDLSLFICLLVINHT